MREKRWIPKVVVAVSLLDLGTVYGLKAQVDSSQQKAAQAEAANEPLQVGSASAKDAAAIHDAETGWYSEALKTRDQRLEWWRDARFGCFVH